MKNKKKYPNWFYPHTKPCKPVKPKEYHIQEKYLESATIPLSTYDKFDVEAIKQEMGKLSHPDAVWKIELDYSDCYGDDSPSIVLNQYITEQIENRYYKSDLILYHKALEKYKLRSELWQELKDRWDKDEKEKKDKQELQLFQKLKKKFDSDETRSTKVK